MDWRCGGSTPSYWAFTFGITALAMAPLKLLARGDSGAIADLAGILSPPRTGGRRRHDRHGPACDARKVVREDRDHSPLGAPLPAQGAEQFARSRGTGMAGNNLLLISDVGFCAALGGPVDTKRA